MGDVNINDRGSRDGMPNDMRHHDPITHDSLPHDPLSHDPKDWNTVANKVTFSRFFLVVAFVVLLVLGGTAGESNIVLRWVALFLFVIGSTTDKVDGYLARSRNEVTDLGKILDPIADKFLTGAAFVVLSIFGELWWWVTILFLVREVGITIFRFIAIRDSGLVIAASAMGKIKTVFEITAIIWVLIPIGSIWFIPDIVVTIWGIAGIVLMLIALALCLYSGAEYLVGYAKAKKAARS